ncbi:MAG: HD domain-containing protein [Nitrososphaeraceae archaeon]
MIINYGLIILPTVTDDNQRNSLDEKHSANVENPLTDSFPWWFELYNRIKLFSWWLKYNMGVAHQAALKDKITELASSMGLQDRWTDRIVRHAVSEFSKKGLGPDYYGYHNIDHELEATYFALLALDGQLKASGVEYRKFSDNDIKYLFVAALFHDYDPLKLSDKPHEDSVEYFLRHDKKIKNFIDDIDISLDLVIVIIYRTTYPFKGENAEHAKKRMHELFLDAGVQENDIRTREHYEYLGWLLSVCERMAGYALGDYEHAKTLARRNAHALGWHPSFINEESVKYFSTLKEEKEMTQGILRYLPEQYKKNFYNNVEAFREAWEDENKTRSSIRRKELSLVCNVEKFSDKGLSSDTRDAVLNIYQELRVPLQLDKSQFVRSLHDSNAILITLKIKEGSGNSGTRNAISSSRDYHNNFSEGVSVTNKIVGFVKGGPIENYTLRRGTHDENWGERNTAYMEWICIKPGYWGEAGGHELRTNFLREAKINGFEFVTGYVHRSVIVNRMKRGESIQIVQKYDPDKLDYYRVDLNKLLIDIMEPSQPRSTSRLSL